jgi:uncharacterized protein YbjT (DUF2867 family)
MGLGWRRTSTAFLPQKGLKLRALVRDPNSNQARRLMGYGEKVFLGNLDDPDSLMRAMVDVYGVVSMRVSVRSWTGR